MDGKSDVSLWPEAWIPQITHRSPSIYWAPTSTALCEFTAQRRKRQRTSTNNLPGHVTRTVGSGRGRQEKVSLADEKVSWTGWCLRSMLMEDPSSLGTAETEEEGKLRRCGVWSGVWGNYGQSSVAGEHREGRVGRMGDCYLGGGFGCKYQVLIHPSRPGSASLSLRMLHPHQAKLITPLGSPPILPGPHQATWYNGSASDNRSSYMRECIVSFN